MSVGAFTLAPGKSAELDGPIDVRSNKVSAPTDRSFAKYLKETLSTELRAAGLLAEGAAIVIRGQLTDSTLEAGVGTGRGSVAARFIADRDGRTVFDKELRASGTWDSSFVGATAIPAAINEYTALHRKLVALLLDDAAFRTAVAR